MRTLYTDVVCAVDHFDLVCACFYLTRNRMDILARLNLENLLLRFAPPPAILPITKSYSVEV